MIQCSLKCFTRISLRNLKVKTHNFYENDIRITEMKKSQFSRVLYYSNSFSHSEEAKCSDLPKIIFSDLSLLRQGSRNTIRKNSSTTANIGFFSQRQSSLTCNGRINRRTALFENSFRYTPTALNVRYQSTTANSDHATPAPSSTPTSTSTVEISESEEVSWSSLAAEDIEYILKDISESSLASGFQHVLENVHNLTGLPWWGTIVLTTIILRTLVIPFSLQQRRVLIKLENSQRGMDDILLQIKKEISMSIKKFGWPVEFAREQYRDKVREEWKELFRRENTHPLKACTLTAIQSPIWMGMSIALANMCCAFPHTDPANQSLYSEMTSGGLGWIQNLTVADSSFILPLTFMMLNLSIVGVVYMQIKNMNIVQTISLSGLSIISLTMALFALDLPSGVVLYWTVSSGYGLIYNLLLTRPGMRKILRIPQLKSDEQLKKDFDAWLTERENLGNLYPRSAHNLKG